MSAVSLLGALLFAKATVLLGRPIPWSAWTPIAYIWQDVLVALLFGLLVWSSRRLRVARARPSGLSRIAYWCLAAYTALNVPIALVLSTPLTWPMLRAASGTLADSILLYATRWNAMLVLSTLGIAALLPVVLGRIAPRPTITRAALALALTIVVLGPEATRRVETIGLHRTPVMALVGSTVPRIAAAAAAADWTAPFEAHETDDFSHLRGAAAGRNVILLSLESTAARYLPLYGATHPITPNLDRLAESAVVFDNAYAVYPESIKGLFSILCSVAPAFDTTPEVYEAAPCRSMAQILGDNGYRTALFHSGRFGYLGMSSIVRGRGFDTLEDAGDIGGHHQSSFGVDEPATVARALSWIDALPHGRRFFLAYLPIAGHHPYETPEPGPLRAYDEIDRYRNALHYGDQALGALMAGLRARRLDENTVWIVLGDHGEAFGQHAGNYGHTFFLYDENVRVPFLVAAPGLLRHAQRSRTTVSLMDTAPTILDVLGVPVPAEYEGHSALDGRPRMALFFTDYSLGLVGLRDGRWKFVHELETRRSKLFDLTADPGETNDVSSAHAARVAAYARRLRGWSAAQKSALTRPRPQEERGNVKVTVVPTPTPLDARISPP